MHVIIGKIKKTLAIKDVDATFAISAIAGFSDELVYFVISIMVARMVTPRALAGVTIVTPIYYFAMVFADMISQSTESSVQTALGAFTKKEAGCYLAVGIQHAIIAGLFILLTTVLGSDIYFNALGVSVQTVDYAKQYLSCAQFGFLLIPLCKTLCKYIDDSSDTVVILLSRAVLILSNTVLSYVLCKNMGLVGIGLAFFVGYLANLLILLTHFMSEHNSVRPVYRKIERHRMGSIKRSIPAGASQLSNLLSSVCMNAIIVRYFTSVSDDCLSYMSVFSNILIASTIFEAIPQTCCSHINLYSVENNEITIEELIKHSLKISSIVAVALSALTIILAPYIPVLFRVSELDYTEEFVVAVRIFAAFFIMRSLYLNYTNFQIALGHDVFSAILTFIIEFVIPVVFAYVWSINFGIMGLFTAAGICPLIAVIVLIAIVKLFTLNTDDYTFPWLFSNTNVDPIVYDMNVTMDNVIELRDRVGEYLTSQGIAKDSVFKTELVIEEFGTLLDTNNEDSVLSEWDVYIYEELVELVVRDEGRFIDFSDDDATKGLSSYVLSCLMPTYGEIHYAKATSENRHRFQILR